MINASLAYAVEVNVASVVTVSVMGDDVLEFGAAVGNVNAVGCGVGLVYL